jgi:phi LC3 family holin
MNKKEGIEMEKKINWKVRFKNKVWLTSFISLIIGFVFNILRLFDIFPIVTENQIMNIVGQILTFLGMFGVITDPTTEGLYDSQRALQYVEPWHDEPADDQDQDPNG